LFYYAICNVGSHKKAATTL